MADNRVDLELVARALGEARGENERVEVLSRHPLGFLERRRLSALLRDKAVPYDVLEHFEYGMAKLRRPQAKAHPLAWLSVNLSGYLAKRVAFHTEGARGQKDLSQLAMRAAAMDVEAEGALFEGVEKNLAKGQSGPSAYLWGQLRKIQNLTRGLHRHGGDKTAVPPEAVREISEFLATENAETAEALVARLKAEGVYVNLAAWGQQLEEALKWKKLYESAEKKPGEGGVVAAKVTGDLFAARNPLFWKTWRDVALSGLGKNSAAAVSAAEDLFAQKNADFAGEFAGFTARFPGDFPRRYYLTRSLLDVNPQRATWAKGLLNPEPGNPPAKPLGEMVPKEPGEANGMAPVPGAKKSSPLLSKLAENLATLDQRASGNNSLGLEQKIAYCQRVLEAKKGNPEVERAVGQLLSSYQKCQVGEWPYAKGLADETRLLTGAPAEALVLNGPEGPAEAAGFNVGLGKKISAGATAEMKGPAEMPVAEAVVQSAPKSPSEAAGFNVGLGKKVSAGAKVEMKGPAEMPVAEAVVQSAPESPAEAVGFNVGLGKKVSGGAKVEMKGPAEMPVAEAVVLNAPEGPGVPSGQTINLISPEELRRGAAGFDDYLSSQSEASRWGFTTETPQEAKERAVVQNLRGLLSQEPHARETLLGHLGRDGFNPRAFMRWLEKEWLDALSPGDAVAFLDEVVGDEGRLLGLLESYPGVEAFLAEADEGVRIRSKLRLLDLLSHYRDSYQNERDELDHFRKLFDRLKEIDEQVTDTALCHGAKASYLGGVMGDEQEPLVVRKKARQILGLLLLPDEEAIPSREALVSAAERENAEAMAVTPLDAPAVDDLIRTRVARESAKAEESLAKLGSFESIARAFLPAGTDLGAGNLEAVVKGLLLEIFRRPWVPRVKLKFLLALQEMLSRRKALTPEVQKILDFHLRRLERFKGLARALDPEVPEPPAGEIESLEALAARGEGGGLGSLPEKYQAFFRGFEPLAAFRAIRHGLLSGREKSALLGVAQGYFQNLGDLSSEKKAGFSRAVEAFKKNLEVAKAQVSQKQPLKTAEAPGEEGARAAVTATRSAPAALKPAEVVDKEVEVKVFTQKMDENLQALVSKHGAAGNPKDLFNEQFAFLQKERSDAKSPELRTFILKTVIPRINYAKATLELLEKLARFAPAERSRSHFKRVLEEIESQYLVPLALGRKDFVYFNAIHFTARYKDILKKPLAEAMAAGLRVDREKVAPLFQKLGLMP